MWERLLFQMRCWWGYWRDLKIGVRCAWGENDRGGGDRRKGGRKQKCIKDKTISLIKVTHRHMRQGQEDTRLRT